MLYVPPSGEYTYTMSVFGNIVLITHELLLNIKYSFLALLLFYRNKEITFFIIFTIT